MTTTAAPIIPETLELIASLEIQASDAKGTPRFSLLANTGEPMRITGFAHPVVIELAGAEFDRETTPVIFDHNTEKRVGHSVKQRIDARGIFAEGIVSSTTSTATAFVTDAKAGFPFQVSVGASVLDAVFVPSGETVNVNDKEFEGPLIVARRTLIRELSITVLGADKNTSALVASVSKNQLFPKEPAMSTQTVELDSAVKIERERMKHINAMLAPPSHGKGWEGVQSEVDELRAKAIDGEVSLADMPGRVRQLAELQDVRCSYPNVGASSRGNNGQAQDFTGDVLQAVLLCRANREAIAEKTLGVRVLEAANAYRSLSFPDICRFALQAEQRDIPHSRDAMIRASLSTNALTTALSGSMDKLLAVTFMEAGATWRSFAAIRPLSNFRTHKVVSPQHRGSLDEVGADGEIHHGFLTDDTSDLKIGTYAKMLGITRQDVINDNLDIFDTILPVFAVQSNRRLNDLVYSVLLGAGSHFHADKGNLLTTGASALSITSLSNAVKSMRKQRDAEGNDLDITPKVLLVPPELETTARALINSLELRDTTADNIGPTGNPLADIAKLEVESRLSNTTKFSSGSTTAWYLLGGPIAAPVYVAFLDGKQTPNLESFGFDSDPKKLAMSWRVFHDFGCGLGEYRSAVKSEGA